MIMTEYDDILIGKKHKISEFQGPYNIPSKQNELTALSIIHYAISGVLGWTPEEALKRFDDYIIEEMHLERVINYITYPVEMEGDKPLYILSRLYPKVIRISQRQAVEKLYVDVLHGKEKQFPRDYFIGMEGFQRYCICLRMLFIEYRPVKNIEELYEVVLSAEGRKFLANHRLMSPAIQLDINITDVLYEITKNNPHAGVYYMRYKIRDALKKGGRENVDG